MAYWRGIRAGKMLTIACSWFKSAGPRVGCGTHPGCTRWLAISRASKAVRCQAEGARGLRRGSGLPGRGVVGHDHLCQRRRWRKGWCRAFGGRSALFCDALPALGERRSDEGRCFWFSAFAQQFTCCDNALSQRCELGNKPGPPRACGTARGPQSARRPPHRCSGDRGSNVFCKSQSSYIVCSITLSTATVLPER